MAANLVSTTQGEFLLVEAALPGRAPEPIGILLHDVSGGGSTIAYRKRLVDSPSYTLNHEEVEKALEEGIRFAENLTPMRIEVDEFGRARCLVVKTLEGEAELAARLPFRH